MTSEHSYEGMLHVIYTAHGSEADFQRIEADLNDVAKECPHLVLVLEDVLPADLFCQRIDPSLRNLPPEVLFDSRTIKRNKEEFARAYASAVTDVGRVYRAWNEAPLARKQTIFSNTSPFNGRLLAWAASHGVELVCVETSLDAWLTQISYFFFQTAAIAGARGDPAAMWAENRKECEILSRAIQLRDADTNAQVTRLLLVERRGHDVLHVVGSLHSVTKDLLVRGLKAVIHERRVPDDNNERFIDALIKNRFDDERVAVREWLETFAFLRDRLLLLLRPATSLNDVAQIIHKIDREAAARNVTLRQIIDHMITTPDFQNQARPLNSVALRWLTAMAFLMGSIDSGFILRREVEEHLNLAAETA
jgi:hypothetical protein